MDRETFSPSPTLFEIGQARGDSSATMTDNAGIAALRDALRRATVSAEGCYGRLYGGTFAGILGGLSLS